MAKKSKKGLFISVEKTIGIREFLREFMGIEYEYDNYLTHHIMRKYLIEKGYDLPVRVNYKDVREEDIFTGRYIAVREETKNKKKGGILVYANPMYLSENRLLEKIKDDVGYDKISLMERRREIVLEEYNMYLNADGETVQITIPKETSEVIDNYQDDEYDIDSSVNRQKVYVMTNGRHLKERRKY